jgi:outer membrane protein assembly factor BamA
MKLCLKTLMLCVFTFIFIVPNTLATDVVADIDLPETPPRSYRFFPVPVPFYSPETGWGIAATVFGYWNSDRSVVRPDTAAFVAIFTEEKQMLFGADIDKYFLDDFLLFEAGTGYRDWQNTFYGIGRQSADIYDDDYEEDFIAVGPRGYLGPSIRLGEGLYAGARWSYNDTDIEILDDDGWMASSNIIGRDGGVISGPGLILKYDTRDSAFSPSRGLLLEAEYNRFSGATGSDFVFSHFRSDIRHFFSLSQNHVLATQIQYEYSSGDIPFYQLPELGGQTGLRGIESGKFVDQLRYTLQAEYRFPLWKRFGGVVFAGAGQSFPSHTDILNDIKVAGGFGLRFMLDTNNKLNIRLDFGFDENGDMKFYFNIREAF